MDIKYFLLERTKFIRFFYESGIVPFESMIVDIENGVDPYGLSSNEDGEPEFQSEWEYAQRAFDMVGHTVLSELSSSVTLFLKEWVRQVEKFSNVVVKVDFKKKGGLNQCVDLLRELGKRPSNCPVDINLIEQILLARNRIQHPEEIISLDVNHIRRDLERYPRPFFSKDSELELLGKKNDEWILPPIVSATKDKIFEAIDSVDRFCKWLDDSYWETNR